MLWGCLERPELDVLCLPWPPLRTHLRYSARPELDDCGHVPERSPATLLQRNHHPAPLIPFRSAAVGWFDGQRGSLLARASADEAMLAQSSPWAHTSLQLIPPP